MTVDGEYDLNNRPLWHQLRRTASVSCRIEGFTYAFCHAKYGTIDVHGSLAPTHLNWMHIPVTRAFEVHDHATAIVKPTDIPISTMHPIRPCPQASYKLPPPATSAVNFPPTTSSEAHSVVPQPKHFIVIFALQLLCLWWDHHFTIARRYDWTQISNSSHIW